MVKEKNGSKVDAWLWERGEKEELIKKKKLCCLESQVIL